MLADRVRLGIAVPQSSLDGQIRASTVREAVQQAEHRGFEDLWVWDGVDGPIPFLEPLDLLTYAAAITSRVRLGVAVLVLPQYNPLQLAKRLATLDHLSDGRSILGVGVGWGEAAYEGIGFPTDRLGARTEEAVAVIGSVWSQPRVQVEGDFWQIRDIAIEPKPVQRPRPPIWFGGSVPAALRRAVRLGDGWIGSGVRDLSDFKQQVSVVRRELDEHGRDPASFAISKRVYVHVAERGHDAERLRRWFGGVYGDPGMADRYLVAGPIDSCVDQLEALCNAGAQHLLLNPIDDEVEQLQLLADAVLGR
jgi:probable F420-dependent oxidoreductase